MSLFLSRIVARITERAGFSKTARWPAGAPNSKGGQFAPAKGGKGGGGQGAFNFGSGAPAPLPASARPHPKANDDGDTVHVLKPTLPSPKSTWTDPKMMAVFTPGGDVPDTLNGVALKPWAGAPTDKAGWASVPGQNPALDAAAPFVPHPQKYTAAGVIIKEPDGRVWLTEPTNHYGGYQQTFPKGTAEPELSLQANAIKEAYEETGLQVRITGIAGDYEKTTSFARFYIAERVGGTPKDMGWETQSVKLAPKVALPHLLNVSADRAIVDEMEWGGFWKRGLAGLVQYQKAAKSAGKKGGHHSAYQKRWPAGTPLGGQWQKMGPSGLIMPPTIAKGLTGSNPSHQKKADGAYAMAMAGDVKGLVDLGVGLQKKVEANAAKGTKNGNVKYTAQTSQYVNQLVTDVIAKPKATAAAAKTTGPTKLSALTKTGSKPGGSNPGGMYADDKGNAVLVKGNKQLASGAVSKAISDDRARNEVLAAKLLQAVGAGAPDMSLVDLEGKFGGGLGVASVMVTGAASFNPGSSAHAAAIREDYAAHAWLGNYDVLGMGYDNTVIKDGKAVNIDPGGAILFRAQGKPKDSFDKDAPEWDSMRKTTSEQKNVFGSMSKGQLKASAEKLSLVSDDTIRKLVEAHGPKEAYSNSDLADTLIARKHAILAKAGVKPGDTPAAEAKPTPPPKPPVVKAAVDNSKIEPGTTPDTPPFTGLAKNVYVASAKAMEEAHADGDLAFLKAMADDPQTASYLAAPTSNGQMLLDHYAAMTADLQDKATDTAQAVAEGSKAVEDAKGLKWSGGPEGVLNPYEGKALDAEDYQAVFTAYMGSAISEAEIGQALVIMDLAKEDGTAIKVAEIQMETPSGKAWQKDVLDKMGVGPGESAPAPSPDSTKKPARAIPVPPETFATLEDATSGGIYAISDLGAVEDIKDGALAGDTAKVAAAKPKGEEAQMLQAAVLEQLANATVEDYSGGIPDAPAPAAPAAKTKSYGPDHFASLQLPEGNSNKASFDKKLAQMQAAYDADDEQALLSASYATNTYGKKAAVIANDLLADMGSVHTVSPGQKKNSHISLVGGTAQPGTTAPPSVKAKQSKAKATGGLGQGGGTTPEPGDTSWVKLAPGETVVRTKEQFGVVSAVIEVPPKGYDAGAFADPPNFFESGKQGPTNTWVSGKADVNEANNAAVQAIHDAAVKVGTVEAVEGLTFPVVQNGTTKMVGIADHPASGVKEYHTQVVSELKAQTQPTYKTEHSGSFTGAYSNAAASIAAELPTLDYTAFQSHTAKAADYMVLSKTAASGLPTPAKGQFKEITPSHKAYKDFKAASQAAYNSVSASQKKALEGYTGNKYINWNSALRTGEHISASFIGAQPMVKAFEEASVEIPEGTVLWRGIGVGASTYASVTGGVIQDGSFNSASYGAHPGGGFLSRPTWLKIHVPKGVKAIDATSFSGFGTGEKEIIIQNNTRYMVLSTETHSNFIDSNGKSWGSKTIVEVMALPH